MLTSKRISTSKFFGDQTYQRYVDELTTQGTVAGQTLTPAERKEGFKKRNNKINFENFVKKVVSTRTAKSAVGPGPNLSPSSGGGGPKGGSLVKSPSGALAKYFEFDKSTKGGMTSNLDDNIATITKTVISILDSLKKQEKLKGSFSEYERRRSEKEKRKLAESKLEKRFKGLKKLAEKIISPVKSILDKILDFFVTIILGRIVYKFVDWLSDPNNANKVKSVIRFVADWWPALLSAYILFGTSFGKFTGTIFKLVGGTILRLTKFAIPQLLKFLKSPLGIGIGLFTAGATIPKLFPETVNQQERKTSGAAGSNEEKIKQLQEQKRNLNLFEKLQGKGAEIDEQIEFLRTGKTKKYTFQSGGFVSGEKGVDRIPAMLSDGEFVMSRGAVSKFGLPFLEALNSSGGGSNKPKIVEGVPHAKEGGLIGDYRENYQPTGSFATDPMGALQRIYSRYAPSTPNASSEPSPGSSTGSSPESSTGSLMNDPLGAAQRIFSKIFPQPLPPLSEETKNDKPPANQDPSIPERMLKSSTFRDSGLLYLRSMFGGLGGPITEGQLSKESKKELESAIRRAKARTADELKIAEMQLKEAKDKKFNAQIIAERQSVYNRLKSGQVRVKYQDYFEDGKITKKAEDAKSILGQFWAQATADGGYRVVNEKYDFVEMPDPLAVLRGDSSGISKGAKSGEPITLRQKLQALHQLNPLAREMSVDMILGKKNDDPIRKFGNTVRMIASSTPTGMLVGGIMGMLGQKQDQNNRREDIAAYQSAMKPNAKSTPYSVKSGAQGPVMKAPKTNQQKLVEKRPWYDKFGWFGGGSRVAQQQAKVAKSKPKSKPVKPPSKPETKVTVIKPKYQGKGARRASASANTPKFNAQSNSRSKINILGISI